MRTERIFMHTAPIETRRTAILDLLREGAVTSQSVLGSLLAEQGLGANQATLSRDLAALGAVKGPAGYSLPVTGGGPTDDPAARVVQAARQYLLEAVPAQNQVLLRTPPGGAAPLAAAIDAAKPADALGTLAGDDTILIVCASSLAAVRVAEWIAEVSS